MDKLPLVYIIIGSTRPGRKGDKVGHWFYNLAKQRTDLHFELIDLADWTIPHYNESLPPKMLAAQYTDKYGKQWGEKISQADAYVFVTPEYNHGYPAALKDALDYPFFEWNKKPAAFVSYSAAIGAGIRAVEQLRLVAVELQMVPIQPAVHIPRVHNVLTEQGTIEDTFYIEGAHDVLDELAWWTKLLKPAREQLKQQ